MQLNIISNLITPILLIVFLTSCSPSNVAVSIYTSDIEEAVSENIQVRLSPVQLSKELKRLEKEMYQYAEELKFEQAADIRNQIKFLRDGQFK